ncbi:MAG: chemotaxis protein CheA [Deltaproteobacteria bacterium]|nr:chemotaxis protein CheA [Deltaproteobacteria bacterium]
MTTLVSPEFVAEAQEIVDALNRDLIAVEDEMRTGADEIDPDRLNNLFRSAHSLKGIAGMFGLEEVAGLAHDMENVLDGMRLGKVSLDTRAVDVLFSCVDRFGVLIEEASRGVKGEGTGSQSLRDQLQKVAEGDEDEGGEDILDTIDIGEEVLGVLTEYEEHRLRENVKRGKNLFTLHTAFDLATFDQGLAQLDAALKGKGEVISKLPSSQETDPGTLAFDIIVGSELSQGELTEIITVDGAEIVPIARKNSKGSSAPAKKEAVPIGAPAPEAAATSEAAPAEAKPKPAKKAEAAKKAEPASSPSPQRAAMQTVRVDIRRLDRLMNMVGELALTKMAVQRLSEELKQDIGFTGMAVELHKASRNFERRLADLQAGIMEVRMVPLDNLFERMVRIGRQIGRELGKRVRIEVKGAHTELDKLIVEDLADPLMHLIRNSVDHGLEAPDERRESGKDEEGRVRLTAVAQGNHVVVEIADDGRGINTEKVLARALERELITEERAREMTDREIFNILFMPGFSTADQVTEYSGRGVGMDVVKTNIAELSGIIDVESEMGVGTKTTVTLPITLAIIPALIVRIADRVYALPLNNVMETLSLQETQIKTIETREVISVRGTTVPLVDLREIFGMEGERSHDAFSVVAGVGESRMALVVDELIGQQDIVIKSLGRRLRNLPGIAGATELGNQKTILVIDMVGLINEMTSQNEERASAAR